MQTFRREVSVNATPTKVFGALTDLSQCRQFMPDMVAMELLTAGKFGVGTQWRETRKIKILGFFPIKATAVIEVDAFEKNKLLGTVARDDCNWARYEFRVSKTGKSSHVVMEGQFKGIGKYQGNDKLAKRLGKYCELADGDLLDRLKEHLESARNT